ncbi:MULTISPECIES: hypothetical protein [Nitrospirillum]|uniref:Uncharacterized protein n=1 Tax=Nitrospirillum amazonense TaxID=28077 RepID=A0A560GEA6_9PROT|nr:hypothetical protein [Nitrospirillum amazonense]MEC4592215.1 hypothetical protein [Nitrospirillum amazonense]TWB32000.1 hypothetical protein FBZ88_101372 [Nitrospirillum amazonense]
MRDLLPGYLMAIGLIVYGFAGVRRAKRTNERIALLMAWRHGHGRIFTKASPPFLRNPLYGPFLQLVFALMAIVGIGLLGLLAWLSIFPAH